MPPIEDDHLYGPWSKVAQSQIDSIHAWLDDRGEKVVGSGRIHCAETEVSVHTDYGPEGQDKETNQDYALLWMEGTPPQTRAPVIVLAMADGLTSSFCSEWGSALASSAAVRSLVADIQSNDDSSFLEMMSIARRAFQSAGEILGSISDLLAVDPSKSCPDGQYISTWRYILRRGLLFQTTLTLTWLYAGRLFFASLGDAGALWRNSPESPIEILARCDELSHEVNALGPTSRTVDGFDFWAERRWKTPAALAIFTDGIGRALGFCNGDRLIEQLQVTQQQGIENPAREFIKDAIARYPTKVDDNLTLAIWTEG
jgi:protein phosphatase 2C-like protein